MNFASKSVIYENSLGSFTCRKAGIWDILFYFPSEGSHIEDFPDARKIQRLQPGLNPQTRVPVANMLTTGQRKPSSAGVRMRFISLIYREGGGRQILRSRGTSYQNSWRQILQFCDLQSHRCLDPI